MTQPSSTPSAPVAAAHPADPPPLDAPTTWSLRASRLQQWRRTVAHLEATLAALAAEEALPATADARRSRIRNHRAQIVENLRVEQRILAALEGAPDDLAA